LPFEILYCGAKNITTLQEGREKIEVRIAPKKPQITITMRFDRYRLEIIKRGG